MSKHTPGPWHVDGHNLTAVIASETKQGLTQDWTTYQHVCDCNYGCTDREKHFEMNKANAKLIAAAPTMLQLIEAINNHPYTALTFEHRAIAKDLLNSLQ